MEPAPADLLIIEDQAPMRRALREHLQAAYPAAIILEAADGASALELCRSHRFRVALTDLGLPDMSGIDLIPQVKALQPAAAVIVVSMYSDPAYVDSSLAAGASAYLTKDKVYRELLPAVARAFGGAHGKSLT